MGKNNKVSTLRRSLTRHKKLVITLSAALGVTGVTAIVAPTMVAVLKKGGGDTPAGVKTITFLRGEHGTIDEEYNYRYIMSGTKYSTISAPAVKADVGYVLAGWMKADGTLISGNDFVNEDMTLTAYYIKEDKKVGVTLDVSEWKEYGVTVSSPYLFVEVGKTWGEVKNSIPNPTEMLYYYYSAYEFQFWYKEFKPGTTEPAEIDDSYVFEENITLKPYYKDLEIEHSEITYTFVCDETKGHYHDQTDVTPLTATVGYCETEGHEELHTFGELAKPVLCLAGQEFSGWYKADPDGHESEPEWLAANKWSNDDPLDGSVTDIYPMFVEVFDNPIITFANPDSDTDYTWIGDKTILCNKSSVTQAELSMPYVYKKISGTPEKGFTSPYYFGGWYCKNDLGEPIDVPDPIEDSITIYPKFTIKPHIVFELDDSENPPTYPEDPAKEETYFYIDPNNTWSSVATPAATTTSTKEDGHFMGWEIVREQEPEEPGEEPIEIHIALTSDYSLENLKTDDVIKPYYSDECNILKFVDEALIAGTEETWDVEYVGTTEVGTNYNKDINFTNQVNKPVPHAMTSGAQDYSFAFNNKWQILGGEFATWTDITDYTNIPGTEVQVTYQIRPVIERKFTITYNHDECELEKFSEELGVIDTVKATSADAFGNLYRPTTIPPENKQFLYWATREGEAGSYVYTPVKQSDTFTADTTLYPVFEEQDISCKVFFELLPSDTTAESISKYPVSISGKKITVNHKPSQTAERENDIKFGDIPKAVVSKAAHVVDHWVVREGEGTEESPYTYNKVINDTDYLPNGGKGITVCPVFTPDPTYLTISVKVNPSEYTITGQNSLFVKSGDIFPVSTIDNTIGITVSKLGWEIVGWKNSKTGNWLYHKKTDTQEYVEPQTVTENLEDIIPDFERSTKAISFEKELSTDELIGCAEGTPVLADYGCNLQTFLDEGGYKAKRDKSEFMGWGVKVGDETVAITNDMTVTSTMTLVPIFQGEAEFKYGDKPYFYDESVKKWAQITDCSSPTEINVYYAGGTTATVAKDDFNYQVLFGTQMTSIPDDFMNGCVRWNNGGKTLTLPSDIKKIGNNFLQSCVSFNQPVVCKKTGYTEGLKSEDLVIGDNFMRNCSKFNKTVSITFEPEGSGEYEPEGALTIGKGFMYECRSFALNADETSGVINIGGFKLINDCWDAESAESGIDPTDWYYTLSTTEKYSNMNQIGFKIYIDTSNLAAVLNRMFPKYEGSGLQTYRNVTVAVKQ